MGKPLKLLPDALGQRGPIFHQTHNPIGVQIGGIDIANDVAKPHEIAKCLTGRFGQYGGSNAWELDTHLL